MQVQLLGNAIEFSCKLLFNPYSLLNTKVSLTPFNLHTIFEHETTVTKKTKRMKRDKNFMIFT